MQIIPKITFTVTMTEQELGILTKGLAMVIGISGAASAPPSEAVRAEAVQLNETLLKQQLMVHDQRMGQLRNKLLYAQSDNTLYAEVERGRKP